MELAGRVDERLWTAVESSYSAASYSTAVLDGVRFLFDLVREKSGLETDGAALIGQALGGKTPKLKITKLQTQSDWNIQAGIEQILRGIYQGIRNPRSHEKRQDSRNDADAILLFVNYLVGIIDQAPAQFEKTSFIARVFDSAFPKNDRYAELLVQELPQKHRLDVLIHIMRDRGKGDPLRLAYFVKAAVVRLQPDELEDIFRVVSAELSVCEDEAAFRTIRQIIPAELWGNISEIARLRAESRMIESASNGKYNTTKNQCVSGGLGTWIVGIRDQLILKEDLVRVITSLLNSSDVAAQAYALQYFGPYLETLAPSPGNKLLEACRSGLEQGDTRFYEGLKWLGSGRPGSPWHRALCVEWLTFKESERPAPMDLTDDDVPF